MADYLPSRGDDPELAIFTSVDVGSSDVDPLVLTEVAGLPREIADGIHWIGNCQPWTGIDGGVVHGHYSSFLIVGTTRTVLVDTGPPASWPTLRAALDACLGGRSLDFVVPTHPEIPHCGNLERLLCAYPQAVAVGDVRDYHLFYPSIADRLRPLEIGEQLDLGGGYRYEAVDAVVKDLPSSQWGYEASRRVLFVADGLSWMHEPDATEHDQPIHRPGECGRIGTGREGFPRLEDVVVFSQFAFYWTRYRADAEALYDRFEALLREYPAAVIAPAHGNVMVDADVVEVLRAAHDTVFREHAGRADAGATDRGEER